MSRVFTPPLPSIAEKNREAVRNVAAELLEQGRQWAARQSPSGPPYPERELQRQIEATKKRGMETGQDVKSRLLELRMRHRDLTGEDGG